MNAAATLALSRAFHSPYGTGTAAVRRSPGVRLVSRGALAVLVCGLLALAVCRFDAPRTAVALVALLVGVGLVLRPEAATLLFAFLLYTNLPAVGYELHHVPKLVASAFMLLPFVPLGHHLVVRHEPMRVDRALLLMGGFLGVLALAALEVKDWSFASERIKSFLLEGLLLYWLVINAIRDLAALRRVLWTLVVAGALLGGLTTYQESTGSFGQQFGGLARRNTEAIELQTALQADPSDVEARQQMAALVRQGAGSRSSRAEGPMDEPNRYAQILVVLVPLAFLLQRTAASRRARVAALAAAGLILAGIVFSYSRGALVALGLLALGAARGRWIRPGHLALACVAGIALVPIAAPKLLERLSSISAVTELARDASAADGAIRGRATEMLAAGQAFADHPLLGVGPGQYKPVYSAKYMQADPRFKFRDIREMRRAHSLYLEIAAETGIVGLTVFLGIIGSLLVELGRARRACAQRRDLRDLTTAFQLSLLAYLTTALFLHLAYERYFWLLMALAGVAAALVQRQCLADDAAPAAGPSVLGGAEASGLRRTLAGIEAAGPAGDLPNEEVGP